jgi:hypothetical protein
VELCVMLLLYLSTSLITFNSLVITRALHLQTDEYVIILMRGQSLYFSM